jgi:hypothetical protein
MIEVVEFDPAHVAAMDVQQAQRIDCNALAEPFGMAYTAMMEGTPIASAGVVEVWPGRGYAWAILGQNCGRAFVAVHRAVLRGISLCGLRRIEMAVAADFPEGRRWAEMLGFQLETPQPMRAYLQDGRDAYLYSRVKNG